MIFTEGATAGIGSVTHATGFGGRILLLVGIVGSLFRLQLLFALHGHRIVGFVGTDKNRLTVGRHVVLVATQPIGRRVGPSGIEVACAVVAAIDHREGILRLAEVLAQHLMLDIEVAIEENSTATVGVVEGLLAVETERTAHIKTRRGEGIVGRFHVAILEQDALCTCQRTHIESAQEVDITCHDAVAVAVGHVCLRDGRVALLAPQFGLEGVFEVDVAEIAHREVLETHTVAREVEHREVTHSTLRLTACRSQHHRTRVGIQTLQLEVGAVDDHTEGILALRTADVVIVGVIDPIDPRGDIDPHGVVGRTFEEGFGRGFGLMAGIGIGYTPTFKERWVVDAFFAFDRMWNWYNDYLANGEINLFPRHQKEPKYPDPFNGSAEWLPSKIGVSIGYKIFDPSLPRKTAKQRRIAKMLSE